VPNLRLLRIRLVSATALLLCAVAVSTGCGGKRNAQARVPSPPAISPSNSSPSEQSANPESSAPNVSASGKAIYVETGMASWYGPSYNHRKAANGEVYDMDQLTAAHRTIPLNSIARVSNMKTGDSVVVRITDRGPFVPDRIIDLSKAA